MHIGLIGGIGPAATELYYRGLVKAHEDAGRAMELTIVHAQVGDMVRNATAGYAAGQAEIFRDLAQRLKEGGADAVAVTSLGGHFCIAEFKAVSPMPVLNAMPAIDAHLAASGFRKVGLIGTRFVMQSGIYGGVSSVDFIPPEGTDLDAVHAPISASRCLQHQAKTTAPTCSKRAGNWSPTGAPKRCFSAAPTYSSPLPGANAAIP
jgi:aspartate racemase